MIAQELLDAARQLGERAGAARCQHDDTRARFERQYFERWAHCHTYSVPDAREVRTALEAAYAEGYREGAAQPDYIRFTYR